MRENHTTLATVSIKFAKGQLENFQHAASAPMQYTYIHRSYLVTALPWKYQHLAPMLYDVFPLAKRFLTQHMQFNNLLTNYG